MASLQRYVSSKYFLARISQGRYETSTSGSLKPIPSLQQSQYCVGTRHSIESGARWVIPRTDRGIEGGSAELEKLEAS